VQDNTRLVPHLVFHPAPTHLGRDTQRQFTRRSRDPPRSKRRQLARQVGACCVLTNSFPLRSRWGVFSNLSSPGRCSASGVLSSCPSTVAMTWYSSPRGMTTMTVFDSHGGGELYDSIPPRQKRSTLVVPPPSSSEEAETGQPWPRRRRHLVGCRTRASRRLRLSPAGHVGHCPRT
jgi:hypothetical protein